MEYKDTLLMKKSSFEMRGNLNIKEPLLLKRWEEENAYESISLNRKNNKEYILHDGPPYANGDMHCGHMLNRILKDIVVRYKNMSGYNTPFIFGWDTHGLPIENQVTKNGVNRKTTPVVEFRKKCEEYALKQVERQKIQIARLGLIGDFAHPYLTLQKEMEAHQIACFAKMALQGLIYKGLKPVYWSPSSESALAEAEIEYADVLSHSIYVAFPVKDGKGVIDNDARVLIWTTTPWTLPANLAISAHPDFLYGEYLTNRGKLVFLKEFAERLKEELDLGEITLLKQFKGRDIDKVVCKHPFYDRDSLMLNGTHVTNEAGTGLVHTAPGHGVEDYQVCLAYNIKPYCPVDEKGRLSEDTGERLKGLFYEDANEVVLQILKENDALIKHSTFTHSYPHDWRTKKPLIFRATSQWFCSIDPIRERLIKEIHRVKWYPAWGENRMVNMIKDRGDWCISRQRVWGVPIPIFYCEDGTPIIEKEVFSHVEDLFREYGSNIWYEKSAKQLLPEGYSNEHSPNGEFSKENDIMDVWFDSGSSFDGVLNERRLGYPADLYLEGSDQYRGWFNSSLIISVACYGCAPYNTVVTHGWVLDEKGEQMHKSKGNGVDPNRFASIYGADVLRLWVATVDYQQDVRIGENLIKQVAEQYRKIRNTLKFISWNLVDYNPEEEIKELTYIDKCMLSRNQDVINKVVDCYEQFDFAGAMSEIMTFMSTDLSSFYLDIAKDSLYCDGENDLRRRQIQAVMFKIAETLLRLLNPVLPFTMDEFNKNLPGKRVENVQLLTFPNKYLEPSHNLENYRNILKLRGDVLKALEESRNQGIIGSSQEADVYMKIKDLNISNSFANIDLDTFAKLCVTSRVNIVERRRGTEYSVSNIKVIHHQGRFCSRCWNYSDNAYKNRDGTYICRRCRNVLKERKR